MTSEKLREIVAPANYDPNGKSLFMAGGISDCPDWQGALRNLLSDQLLIVFNPRRPDFPLNDPSAAQAQIEWEYTYLRKASAISFWFPSETLCPIVLYELGAWSMTDKTIFVGAHPEYQRRQDVEIQTSLVRKDVQMVSSLDELADQIKAWAP